MPTTSDLSERERNEDEFVVPCCISVPQESRFFPAAKLISNDVCDRFRTRQSLKSISRGTTSQSHAFYFRSSQSYRKYYYFVQLKLDGLFFFFSNFSLVNSTYDWNRVYKNCDKSIIVHNITHLHFWISFTGTRITTWCAKLIVT